MSLSEGTLCFVHWLHPQTLIMSALHWSVTNCVTFSWKFNSPVKYETGHCMTHSTQSLRPFWLCNFWFLFLSTSSTWNERCPEWTQNGFTAMDTLWLYQNHTDFCNKLRQWNLSSVITLRETIVSAVLVQLVGFFFPHVLESQFWSIQILLRTVSVMYMIWNTLGWNEKFCIIYDTAVLNLLATLKNNNRRWNIF